MDQLVKRDYHIDRIQAQRRVRIKRKLRRLGVEIPSAAMHNLAFLQLLLRLREGR